MTKLSEAQQGQEADHFYDDWIVCDACGGRGVFEDCFEDTCVCLNPPCYWAPCDMCEGKGGWPACDEAGA